MTGFSSRLVPSVSVVIPTLGRERVLVETVTHLLDLPHGAEEILVVDQSPSHDQETTTALQGWDARGRIRWIRREKPSIPAAMNEGLRQAKSEVVLFVDDDVIPHSALVETHRRTYVESDVVAVAGMVLQPGENPLAGPSSGPRGEGLWRDLDFCFRSSERADVWNVMAGNLSVRKSGALACGGFDESFVGVAYRFETEFCRRLRRGGGRIVYEPGAVIHHLKAPTGGTRIRGSHLTSPSPSHSVGDYYFAYLEGAGPARWRYIARRILREVATRFHARRPWWIPVKLVGEVRGLLLARKLYREKPRDARSAA